VGFFLYQGVTDPLGGVNTLWPLFGISNRMLAAIALILATVVLFRMKRERYAWVTIVPAIWLLVCSLSAGLLKLISVDPKVGFIAHAVTFQAAVGRGDILSPAKTIEEMHSIAFNDRVDAALALLFILPVFSILVFGLRAGFIAFRIDRSTAHELPAEATAT
jgi:carbon starvation protein CstA